MPRMSRKRIKDRTQTNEPTSSVARGPGTLDFIIGKPSLPPDEGRYEFHLDFRKFTASEVYSITGVSPTTQRDWRRRGIVRTQWPAEGWNRYTFPDLAFFLIVRLLTARGVAASIAALLANDSILRVWGLLMARRDAVRFNSPDRNILRIKGGPIDRFVVAALPPLAAHDDEGLRFLGFANLSALNSFFRQNPQAIASVIVDLKRVVDRICDLAPKPLLTVRDETRDLEVGERIPTVEHVDES